MHKKAEAEITAKVKFITPKMAKKTIDAHENYRPVSSNRVGAYASAMAKGFWGLSILVFDKEGVLVDGQTRLNAVVKTGIGQRFVCLYGWPKDDVKNLDNNQTRSRGQVAKAELGLSNASRLMAAAVGIDTKFGVGSAGITNAEALTVYAQHEKVVGDVLSRLTSRELKGADLAAGFGRAIIAYPEHREDILQAVEDFNGLNFASERMSGLRLYYQWAFRDRKRKYGHGGRKESYLRLARAVLSYIENEPISRLHALKDDPFDFAFD